MSKTRRKTHSQTEHLQGQIKKLKSENRNLRKKLKYLEKQAHFYEDVIEEVTEDVEILQKCPGCGKGNLQEMDLHHILLIRCDLCEYKETRKPKK